MNGWLDKMFDRCKKKWPWLAEQPEMIPWDDGCRRLGDRLGQWLEGYSEAVCTKAVRHDHPTREKYVNRLMQCLGHHWDHAVKADSRSKVPSTTAATRIQSGRGYKRGEKLGGDPMRDTVLAVAMVLHDEKALKVFTDDYYNLCRAKASNLNRRLVGESVDGPDEWWNDLLDFLAGYTQPKAKLDAFHGKSALKNWLPKLVWRYLIGWMKREWKHTTQEEIHDMTEPEPLNDPSLVGFVKLIRQSLKVLANDELILLGLIYVDGMKQKEAAAVVRIHPGNVSRRLDRAIEKLRAEIVRLASQHPDFGSHDGVLEDITEDPQAFAAALLAALRDAMNDNQEDRS